ncbi:hypothetical protein AVEN_64756-1 [Araneus ventricosus]|uniref:Uncharacterized protein n=1 Tax=Araneus ventricosus TaxID=182803 RepID=A0A4Y2VR82_ARAVE|nr:hypothetical protein AVEN_64756-1 [Araneus ventricosus]
MNEEMKKFKLKNGNAKNEFRNVGVKKKLQNGHLKKKFKLQNGNVKKKIQIAERKRQEEIEERRHQEEIELRKLKHEEQKRKEEFEEPKRKDEMEFELQKIRLGAEGRFSNSIANQTVNNTYIKPKSEIHHLMEKFNSDENDISLYLIMFERLAKQAEILENTWVTNSFAWLFAV